MKREVSEPLRTIEPPNTTYAPPVPPVAEEPNQFKKPRLSPNPNQYQNQNHTHYQPPPRTMSATSPTFAPMNVNVNPLTISTLSPMVAPYESPGMAGGSLPSPVGVGAMGIPSPGVMTSPILSPYGGMGYSMFTGPAISPSMDPNSFTGNYGPAAAAAAAAPARNKDGRNIYVGNLSPESHVDELLNLVKVGPIESVKIVPEKNCAFIGFLDGSAAAAFYKDAMKKKLALRGSGLRIDWGHPSPLPPRLAQARQENPRICRNVYLGNLDNEIDEQDLRDDMAIYGPIDQLKVLRNQGERKDHSIGFVHFLSMSTAMKVVETLRKHPDWQGKRVDYGEDRCAFVPKNQRDRMREVKAQQLIASSAMYGVSPVFAFNNNNFPTSNPYPVPAVQNPVDNIAATQLGNRTIFIGNITKETTASDLCNIIRGGVLESIKMLPEKKIAFVTFVDPNSALAFYRHGHYNGLVVNTHPVQVGWGKKISPLNVELYAAMQNGITRNVYLGFTNKEDFESFTEERLAKDFEEFGEIELINFLEEKSVAFVNFTSIQSAQKAISGIQGREEYKNVKINFGKDRCALPIRPSGMSRSGPRRSPNSNGNHSAVPDVPMEQADANGMENGDGDEGEDAGMQEE